MYLLARTPHMCHGGVAGVQHTSCGLFMQHVHNTHASAANASPTLGVQNDWQDEADVLPLAEQTFDASSFDVSLAINTHAL